MGGGLFCITIADFEFDDGIRKHIEIDFQFRIKMVTHTYMRTSIVLIIGFLCCFIEWKRDTV